MWDLLFDIAIYIQQPLMNRAINHLNLNRNIAHINNNNNNCLMYRG